MTRGMSTFPPEVLARIFVLVSRPDLRNIRLLSRTGDDVAGRILFETVFLRINLQSFERLQDIAQHDKLSKYVRIISYDRRTLDGSAAREGFQDWLRCTAGAGLALVWTAKDEFLAQFSMRHLEKYYFNYYRYLFAQDYMLRRGNEKKNAGRRSQKAPRIVKYTIHCHVNGTDGFSREGAPID